MADRTTQSLLEEALEKFKGGLTRREIGSFGATTLEALQTSIHQIQAKQHAQRRLQGLNRLERFVEAIKQFRIVVDRIYDSNRLAAFIWVGRSHPISIDIRSAHCFEGHSHVSAPGMAPPSPVMLRC